MVMEFAEFAEKFRERTAKRLLEFEDKLEKAQQELEKQAQQQAQTQAGQQAKQNSQQREEVAQREANAWSAQSQRQAEPNPYRARRYGNNAPANSVSGVNHLRDATRAGRPRQVKSVLRRGPD